MIKRLTVFIVAALAMCSCATTRFSDYPTVFAHRGCWLSEDSQTISRESFLVPENSLSGVRMAVRFGYVYSCHLFLISSASVRSIQFLSFIELIFA